VAKECNFHGALLLEGFLEADDFEIQKLEKENMRRSHFSINPFFTSA